MSYDPRPLPAEHMMQFDRWTIFNNVLYLTFSYIKSSMNSYPYTKSSVGWYFSYSRTFRFAGYAPDITAPLDFASGTMVETDSRFSLPSGQSYAAVARIIFDPDSPIVTWGGPLITLRITIPDVYAEFDFEVRLPAYTDPVSLDGNVRPI
jgi:hypothetical protein